MRLAIEFQDNEDESLSQHAREELISNIEKYGSDLLAEAGRLEAVRRDHIGPPEITRSMVKDAVLLARRYPRRNSASKTMVWMRILAAIFAIVTGGLFDIGVLQENQVLLLIFIGVLIATVVLNVFSISGGQSWQ